MTKFSLSVLPQSYDSYSRRWLAVNKWLTPLNAASSLRENPLSLLLVRGSRSVVTFHTWYNTVNNVSFCAVLISFSHARHFDSTRFQETLIGHGWIMREHVEREREKEKKNTFLPDLITLRSIRFHDRSFPPSHAIRFKTIFLVRISLSRIIKGSKDERKERKKERFANSLRSVE